MPIGLVIAILAALALVAANAAAELPDTRLAAPAPMALLPPETVPPPKHMPTARPAPTVGRRSLAAASAVPPRPAPAARPLATNRLVHEANRGHLCIGGVLCEEFCAGEGRACTPVRTLFIRLDRPTRIDTIQLSAHDNVGPSRRSRLLVKVNGRQVGSTLVYRLGSTLSFDIDTAGELITIESEHQYNGFHRGGEEAVVWDVYVFGEEQS